MQTTWSLIKLNYAAAECVDTCLEIASDAKEYLKQTLSLEHLLVSYFEILSL